MSTEVGEGVGLSVGRKKGKGVDLSVGRKKGEGKGGFQRKLVLDMG